MLHGEFELVNSNLVYRCIFNKLDIILLGIHIIFYQDPLIGAMDAGGVFGPENKGDKPITIITDLCVMFGIRAAENQPWGNTSSRENLLDGFLNPKKFH